MWLRSPARGCASTSAKSLARCSAACAAAIWLGVAVSSSSARDHTPSASAIQPAAEPQPLASVAAAEAQAESAVAAATDHAAAPAHAVAPDHAAAPDQAHSGGEPSRAQPEASVDPALAAARDIARRVRSFHSFRSEIPLGTWRTAPQSSWRVRNSARCLAAAERQQLAAAPLARVLTTPVPTPIVLTGAVAGVSFRPVQSDRAIELSCEMATRLPALAALLKQHGVRAVHVNSSYREQPRVSFHTFGLALDISGFETTAGPLVVATDFEATPDVKTCAAKPTSERGRALLALACALSDSGMFSSVLTPNYNAGHRDHFHLDIRPDDARLFLR